MNGRRPLVSVIGAAECSAEQQASAEAVGRGLAEGGAIIVCGGRGGVMEAACRGAQQAGGLTVGILPGDRSSDGNAFLSIALPTGLGHARNALVVLAGQVVVAIGGGAGTLSEIGLACRCGRDVIGLGTWECLRADGEQLPIRIVKTADQAVAAAFEILSRESRGNNA